MFNNEIQNQSMVGIDLAILEKELLTVEQEIKAIEGREIVLVIGNTGSGKSTLINYLQGRKLKRYENTAAATEWLDAVDVSGIRSPVIGHEAISQTEYPEAFECAKSYLLCDTSGYQDNRSKEKDLCTYLAIQLVARYAAKIKGIIAVIEVPAMEATRGNGGFESLSIINNLFADQSHLASSITYVFTKSETANRQSLTREQIIARIDNKAKAMVNEPSLKSELEKLKVILENPHNVFIPNLLDEGQTRQALFERIGAYVPITKDKLHLSIGEREYAGLREMITVITHLYTTTVQNRSANAAEIVRLEKAISDSQNILTTLYAQKREFETQRGGRPLNIAQYTSRLNDAQRYAAECEAAVAKVRAAGPIFTWSNGTTCLNGNLTIEANGSFTFSRNNEVLRVAGPLNQNSSNIARAAWDTEIMGLQSKSQQAKEALNTAQANYRSEEAYNEKLKQIEKHEGEQSQANARLLKLKQDNEQYTKKLEENDPRFQMVVRLNRYFDFKEADVINFINHYSSSAQQLDAFEVLTQQLKALEVVNIERFDELAIQEADQIAVNGVDSINERKAEQPLERLGFFAARVPNSFDSLLRSGRVETITPDTQQIIFSDKETAKAVASELLNAGMGNRQMPNSPKKVEPISLDTSQECYAITLTNVECDALGIANNGIGGVSNQLRQ